MKALETLERGFDHATAWAHHHRRGIVAGVVSLLLGTGITAFGVAPFTATDVPPLASRTIAEEVLPVALDAQVEALDQYLLELTRSDLTRSSDTVDSLLSRLNVSDVEAAAFLRSDAVARKLLQGRPGKMVQVVTGERGQLRELIARYPAEDPARFNTHFTRLTVIRDPLGFRARTEQAPLSSQVRLGSGTIRTSLFAATDEARLPDTVASQLAEMFANEIDFAHDLRRGDHFSVLFEALEADGEPITWNQAAGRVLAAEFRNGGKTYEAVWYQAPGTKGAYFDFKGQSMRRAFLASPMEFSRVTSGFAMRFHPVHKTWRRHLGVDYGAPTGTAVRTVGEGVVEFAGVQNGYGNVVYIKHRGERVTVYAHLSRIGVRKGQMVAQGQYIGAVGATGWATGPHLHFEFRQGGEHVDPLQIARASEAVTIPAAARPMFMVHAGAMKTQLAAAAAGTSVASAD
ncbi:M23 family metallopeptidase [Aquabacterium sp. A7-Y]|uniref:M23 family metallopeptidase n=1 Tax=Aquabacterium sp. A7-Y TaxID=1349605 RepID=UPI00223DECE8|nr:M23 family metallopeptidase [Aquabacterium sp. A7-Y]MCW7539918.1 M23 family metallopeptidase [Aquabacterium sp. A7-Y]